MTAAVATRGAGTIQGSALPLMFVNPSPSSDCSDRTPAHTSRADLLAHDQLELSQAHPALLVAQLPVERDTEEVGVGHVQLGLERLVNRHINVLSDARHIMLLIVS